MGVEQRTFHIITELLAIPVGIYLIWLGTKMKVKFHKVALIVIGAGNLLIDGYLLFTW